MKGSPVVLIGVDRRRVGRENGVRWRLPCLRFLAGTVSGMTLSARVHGKRYL